MVSLHKGIAAAMLAGVASAAPAIAGDLLPAEAVLARIASKPDNTAATAASPAAKLLKDIAAFQARSAQLAAPAAAAQWLALWDRSLGVDARRAAADYDAYDVARRSPVGPRSMLAALPAPQAWPLIRAEANARVAKAPDDASALGLQLLAEVLARDAGAARQSLAGFERLAASRDAGEREIKLQTIDDMRALTYKLYGSREQIADAFRATLVSRAKRGYGARVEVPDLVGLLGAPKAEALIADALKRPVVLYVPEGVATKALARKLALRDVRSLRKAQWGLVDDTGTSGLYEALQARFDPRGATDKTASTDEGEAEFDYERRQADVYYFLDLVLAGRHADAERAMVRASGRGDWGVSRRAMSDLARRGENAAVHAYLNDLLRRRPQLPAWDFYLQQAGLLGRSSEALALLDATLKRTDLTPPIRADLQDKRLDALLGADRIDDAVAGYRALLATAPSRDDPRLSQRTTSALRLAGLGRVMKQPEWSRLGIDYATKAVAFPPTEQSYWRPAALRDLLVEMRREGRADAAQSIALAELEREDEARNYKGFEAIIADPARRAALVELVGLYDAADRPDAVRRILDGASLWAAGDLAELAAQRDSMGTPIGLMAARALRAGGDIKGATAAARAVIEQLPNHDPAYQLFTDLAGDASIAELDGMATRDGFEERPLVWKATVLVRMRQYEAAEDSARRAIAIDPSDGEQGVNDRMRAYAILADALEGKGDLKSAQGYRRAVAAIRLSEQADEMHKLGLYQRAFAGYRAALAEFSDAYCIQSRLAVQLSRLGFNDEALKHYRRAFELMPDSFGRVESHCFGCESVFAGANAQTVAEEVFTALVKRDTAKPQAAYMLGYLRKEEGRFNEAAALFRRAIALDALYLNAWRQLNDVGDKTYIEPAERDIARLRLFELDPRQRHVRYQLNEVADLPSLWHAIARLEGGSGGTSKSAALYPLTASERARQDALGKLPPEMRVRMEQYIAVEQTLGESARDGRPTPSLADHKLLLATLRVMGAAPDTEMPD